MCLSRGGNSRTDRFATSDTVDNGRHNGKRVIFQKKGPVSFLNFRKFECHGMPPSAGNGTQWKRRPCPHGTTGYAGRHHPVAYFRLPMIETQVTVSRMTAPPMIVFPPGFSPRTRKTHNGFSTGSMTAMRFADTADTRLIA